MTVVSAAQYGPSIKPRCDPGILAISARCGIGVASDNASVIFMGRSSFSFQSLLEGLQIESCEGERVGGHPHSPGRETPAPLGTWREQGALDWSKARGL